MKKRAKQPLVTIRAWVPWTLLGLGLAEVCLSIFQWVELRTVEAGGTAVCSINATVNCETVWTSPFAQRLSALTGLPVAGLGVVWGLAAAVCAGSLLWRARSDRPLRPAVLPIRTVGVIAALACITLVAGSISAGALCPHLPRHLRWSSATRASPWLRSRDPPACPRRVGGGPWAFLQSLPPVAWGILLPVAPARTAGALPPREREQERAARGGGRPAVPASRPASEKQALADALAHFARTPRPTQPELLRAPGC
jgi:serine/threonine-protein kinase